MARQNGNGTKPRKSAPGTPIEKLKPAGQIAALDRIAAWPKASPPVDDPTVPRLVREYILRLLTDPGFRKRWRGKLEPGMFAPPEYKWIAAWAFDSAAPSVAALRIEIESPKVAWTATPVRAELMAETVKQLSDTGEPDPELAAYIDDRVEHFIQICEYERANRTAAERLINGDIAGAYKVLRESELTLNHGSENDGSEITFSETAGLTEIADYLSPRQPQAIPTGIAKLNRLMRGGLRPGELGVLMAPLKRGKSQALVHLTAEAARRGHPVAHYTLEMSATDIDLRYVTNLSNTKQDDFPRTGRDTESAEVDVDELRSIITERIRRLQLVDDVAPVRIKWLPRGSTVADIEAHLAGLSPAPELIVVDYGDLLSSGRGTGRDRNTYIEQGDVYAELRDLAMRLKVPVWTASQTTRESLKPNLRSMGPQHVADSLGKARIADFVIAMDQTAKEEENNEMRLDIVASRRGHKGWMRVAVDFDLARLYRPVDWGDDDSEKGDENIDDRIAAALESGPQTAKQLAEAVGSDAHAVRTALNRLDKVGRAATAGTLHKEKLWELSQQRRMDTDDE
jgi:hypothetical protein